MLGKFRRTHVITLLAVMLLIAASTASQAKPWGFSCYWKWDFSYSPPQHILVIDWHGRDIINFQLSSFQFYLQSDPGKSGFQNLEILSPFGPNPPAAGFDLGGGLFRVTGDAPAGTLPPSGEVNIATFRFTDLDYTGVMPLYTVFAGLDGYGMLSDGTRIGPDDIDPASTVPEPGSAVALLTGAMGLAGLGIRRRMTS